MVCNTHCGIRCKLHSALALDNYYPVEVAVLPLLSSYYTDLAARTKVPLSAERMEVVCVRVEVNLVHRKAQQVVHDYEQIEAE